MTDASNNFLTQAKDPTCTLNDFHLEDLAQFKRAKSFSEGDSPDYRTFYVGPDDTHNCLKYLLSRCSRSLKFNMFGYDDDEIDAIIVNLIENDHVYVQGTLDKSQSGGVHEKKILAMWSEEVRASFAIGQSATHQISHTKGGVIDGKVAWEGSMNLSASGEGTIVDPAGTDKGRKAQNNTLLIHINPVQVEEFSAELDEEHSVALRQMSNLTAATIQAAGNQLGTS